MNFPDQRPDLRYDFRYTENSTYARAARLVVGHTDRGLVVDLGCGAGVLGLALAEAGYDYLGVDLDADAVGAARERGIAAEVIDLADIDDAIEPLRSFIGGRRIAAVSLLDVVEHLPEPDRTMGAIARLVDSLAGDAGAPLLVVSIPNVTHADLGAKLVTGRWDVTEVGLLDDTHITLFSEERLVDVMTRAGFVEVAADDNVHDRTEQEFPLDHPAIGRVTVLARFLRGLRRQGGSGPETYQFIRCYRRATVAERDERTAALAPRPTGRADDRAPHRDQPFLSVVVRTRGDRASLLDALTSLAAQTDDDFEVLVMVHHDDPSATVRVQRDVDGFAAEFSDRVRVVPVREGRRSRPLNVAIGIAVGRYIALLDDDDLATADWVERFRSGVVESPGTIVRAPCVLQWTSRADGGPDGTVISGFEAPYPVGFDYLDHVRRNRSPSCSYAVPLAAVRALGIGFDEDLEACEDWKFLMDVARWTGVTDVADPERPTATSIYRRSRDGGGSDGVVDPERWSRDHLAVAAHLAAEPSIVPAGSLMKVRQLYEVIEQRDEAIVALQNRVDALERSRIWALTAPLRRLAGLRSKLMVRRGE